MVLGFTGTRKGLTTKQREALLTVIKDLAAKPSIRIAGDVVSYVQEAHHGMCIGADASFHHMIRAYLPLTKIHGHPSFMTGLTAMLNADKLYPVAPPLIRNRDIVVRLDFAVNHLLLACPGTAEEELRSGTWATVRYARKRRLHISIINPDGSVRQETPK